MRSHHAKIVKQVLHEPGINYLYLPPYSPDLNLITINEQVRDFA